MQVTELEVNNTKVPIIIEHAESAPSLGENFKIIEAPNENIQFACSSDVGPFNKGTEGCYDCIAAIACGLTPKGEVLSVLAHIAPDFALGENSEIDYPNLLKELKDKTLKSSWNCLVVGGIYKPLTEGKFSWHPYPEMINKIKKIYWDELGIEPIVDQPKTSWGKTDVYVFNKDRSLKVIVVETPEEVKTFSYDDFVKDWELATAVR